MPSFLWIRHLARGAAVVFVAGSVAACGGTGITLAGVLTSALASVEPTLAPTPTPTPTPISTLDSFKTKVTSSDFQAQGSVVGSIAVTTIFGSTPGQVTGTFKVKGGDSADSISSKILGITATNDNIVVGDWAYSRTNGGEWTKTPASGKTLQGFVGSGIVLTDEGPEAKFGRQLHRLTVANMAGVDLSAFGIAAGPGQENLTVSSLSFWAEDDGTPAGLSIQASLDQKIFNTPSHETVTLDISIDTLSGVTITAPTS
jgi:hypothetical protein